MGRGQILLGALVGLVLGCTGSISGGPGDGDPRGGYAEDPGGISTLGSPDGGTGDPGSGNPSDPGGLPSEDPPFPDDLPATGKKFLASRTSCMAPCAVHFNAQIEEGLTWDEVVDGRFIWDFDDKGASSEGFLAAHVFDSAGSYEVGVAVNGEVWTRTTIQVSAPSRTMCISPSSSFADCPSSSGSDHFTSLSAVGSQSHRNAHVLLHRGESFGSIGNFKDQGPTLYGAYGSGAKPKLTQSDVEVIGTNVVWQDLDISVSRVLELSDWSVVRRVDATGAIGGDPQYWLIAYYVNDFFVVDSNANVSDGGNGGPLYVYQSQRSALKGNMIYRQAGGSGHTVRINGADGFLIQGNTFNDDDGVDMVTIRGDNGSSSPSIPGNAYWTLVQGNEFQDNVSVIKPQYAEANELVQYLIWEDNVHTNGAGLISVSAHDVVVRENLFQGGGVQVQDSSNYYDPENIEIYDNTMN